MCLCASLSGAMLRPQPSLEYFKSMLKRRVVVALYYERPQRWLPYSGILEYDDRLKEYQVAFDTSAGALGIYQLR